jgi:hypothetical protein
LNLIKFVAFKKIYLKKKKKKIEMYKSTVPYKNFSNGNVVHDPHLPYQGQVQLFPGRQVHLSGYVPEDCHRFEVNFKAGNDYPLHFNPRFDQGAVVLNSKEGGSWGSEERHDLNINKGENFQLIITVHEDRYSFSINGHYYWDYVHRVFTFFFF